MTTTTTDDSDEVCTGRQVRRGPTHDGRFGGFALLWVNWVVVVGPLRGCWQRQQNVDRAPRLRKTNPLPKQGIALSDGRNRPAYRDFGLNEMAASNAAMATTMNTPMFTTRLVSPLPQPMVGKPGVRRVNIGSLQ